MNDANLKPSYLVGATGLVQRTTLRRLLVTPSLSHRLSVCAPVSHDGALLEGSIEFLTSSQLLVKH